MVKRNIILMILPALLFGCSSKNISSSSEKKESKPKETSTPVATPISTPSQNTTQTTPDIENNVSKQKSMLKAMRFDIPDGWKIIATGIASPYVNMTTDYIGIMNGDKRIEVTMIMRSPAGIGYDRVYDRTIDNLVIGLYEFSGGTSDNNTHLELISKTALFQNPEHGDMFVNYINPEGVSENDSDLISFLESLQVNDCFGTVTVKAKEINIRDAANTGGNKVGTAKIGSTYKVYSVEGPTEHSEYTWYNIGDSEFIADKNGEWVSFDQNE